MRVHHLIFVLVFFHAGCAHRAPVPTRSPADFLPSMRLEGEGKARLEAGAESWVFSFDAVYRPDHAWVMALRIPLQGESLFTVPGLDLPEPAAVPSKGDFRWRVVHALREASRRRKLDYPEVGEDFTSRLHHLLRMLRPGAAAPDCRPDGKQRWSCVADGRPTVWAWNEAKEELALSFPLRPGWELTAVFKNLTGPVFRRVTLEVSRAGAPAGTAELRQEFFFNAP